MDLSVLRRDRPLARNNAVYTQADIDAFEQYVPCGRQRIVLSPTRIFGSDWGRRIKTLTSSFLDLIGVKRTSRSGKLT